MGISSVLLFAPFYLVCMAIDVVLFFLLTRVCVLRWRIWWLVSLDQIGQNLVEGLLRRAGKLWYRAFHKQLSDRGKLIVAIVLFYVLWLAVHSMVPILW